MTRSPVRSGGGYRDGEPFVVLLGDGDPVDLAGDVGLSLAATEQVRVRQLNDGEFVARVVAYRYELHLGGRELLAFHWHPQGASHVKTPHLHVAADVQVGERWLASAHLPTGHIAFVDVLWLALEDFGVRALRDDWRSVLERSRRG